MCSIKFPELYRAEFIERPNKFIVNCTFKSDKVFKDYNIDDDIISAHLQDPGKLPGLLEKGRNLWLRYAGHPGRKTDWSAVLVENPEIENSYISLNSTLPNRLVEKALKKNGFKEFRDWNLIQSEFTYNTSRWDFLLKNDRGREMLLEVKSVTWARDKTGLFPDTITARGRKHIEKLTEFHKKKIYKSAVLFIAQRGDIDKIKPAADIDPQFALALSKAKKAGVKIMARKTNANTSEVKLGGKIPVIIQ
ncbi:MAG: DNA/RNA nuclease SfsA [Halanaerobiales bacterium]